MAVNVCPSCTLGVNHTNAIWARAAAGITKKRAVNITAGSLNIKDSYPIWISQLTRLGRILEHLMNLQPSTRTWFAVWCLVKSCYPR